jgi:long-subunit acyl-CoA synthetase (AMP-forming)
MSGYLGDKENTKALIATGDLGSIDSDGFVYVRGRKKNLFISSMGRNVSPEWIECELMREECVRQAVVFGEGRMHPMAILSPMRLDTSDRELSSAVSEANRRLPDYAQVREWVRVSEPLDCRSGLLTANGRPRRDRIAERYRSLIERAACARVSSLEEHHAI